MTDKEQAVAPHLNDGNGLPERLGVFGVFGASEGYGDFTADEDWATDSSDYGMGLVSLGFLKAAIRRSALFCWVMTIVGFLVGCGIYVKFPAPYKATTSLLLTYGPYENATTAASDEQAIAQTSTVAALAMHKLGLKESADSFLKEYTVTVVSTRVLLITFTARSGSQAVHGANAVATEFLQFRAGQLEKDQARVLTALQQQVSQAGRKVDSIKAQISQLPAYPFSAAQRSRLNGLQTELKKANATLGNLQQAVDGNKATDQPATSAAIEGSQVLDAASLLPRSHLRYLLLYPGAGLVGGLAVGIAIVLIRAIVSDRLRRRDDVANALGVPVKLSTASLRPGRLRPGRPAGREADIRRIAAYLGRAVSGNARGIAALAVVAVDDPEAVALPLVSLATSCAQQGRRVVLADLAVGAPAARLLGAGDAPGVGAVSAQSARLMVAVPERDDVVSAGPFGPSARDQRSPFTDAVAAACSQADLLLTLVTLDPALGSEHLPTWAADSVAVVTAGRSSWTKINAVGEMIRLSGTRLASAVLIGADRTDESLGVVPAQQDGHGAGVAEQGPPPDVNGFRAAGGEGQGRHRSAGGDFRADKRLLLPVPRRRWPYHHHPFGAPI